MSVPERHRAAAAPAESAPRTVKLLLLSKYSYKGASSRYRLLQYLPQLESAGIHCTVSPLFGDDYLEFLYRAGRPRKRTVVMAYLKRARALLKVREYDAVLVEKELFPYFPPWVERALAGMDFRLVSSYDDALFHQYDRHSSGLIRRLLGGKIDAVMRHSRLVIAGNSYLGDHAREAGCPQVEFLPTVVDLERYRLRPAQRQEKDVFSVVWIGSPTTAAYLGSIAPALAALSSIPNTRIVLIGSGPIELPGVSAEIHEWSSDTENRLLSECHVGIMPLPDEPWAKGKCGFKLVQYMASGLPVVASPVGVNCSLVEPSVNGYLATDRDEWLAAFEQLRRYPEQARQLGARGRDKVEREYSLQATAPKMVDMLREAAGA